MSTPFCTADPYETVEVHGIFLDEGDIAPAFIVHVGEADTWQVFDADDMRLITEYQWVGDGDWSWTEAVNIVAEIGGAA